MDMRIPPLKFKIMLESSPLKSRVLVRGLAVLAAGSVIPPPPSAAAGAGAPSAKRRRPVQLTMQAAP